jgi:hypothetical protein
MPPTGIFCDVPLSTGFSRDLENSSLSLEWVLASGVPATHSMVSGILSLPCTDGELETVCRLQIQLPVTSSLPFDLVLGRDWLQFSRDSLPNACFHLTSGPLDLRTPRGVFLGLRSNDMASH